MDEIFDALSDRSRRRVLVTLWKQVPAGDAKSDPVGLSDVVTTDSDERRVRTEMVHCHLPKLEEDGYIRWDSDAGTIERGPEWDALVSVLRVLSDYRARTNHRA